MRKLKRAGMVLLLMGLGVEALWAWPWSRDMVIEPIIRPLLIMLTPAPGAVMVGAEPQMTREQADQLLHNPLPATPENLAAGKNLYGTFCQLCHGISGRGDGPVAQASSGALPAADLTKATIQQQSDGFLYSTIRYGRLSMPEYQESLSPKERWQVILYVRTLGQKQP